jgi:DNA invertase Pin-like site-specific DNA recombinase
MSNEVKVIKATTSMVGRNRPEGQTKLRVAAYCRVSTDSDEQKESFKSQVKYYTDLINGNPDWENAGIYADEAISGTKADKRPEFLRMISDCMAGKIDIVLTKSLSRFARNTVDTLKYVRALKAKSVSVRFEEEKIDSLTSNGELMLTVLSSVAQQEVSNTSEHVKRGLSMMMSRGELVGFQSCLGYDYDPNTKKITVNEREAAIVKYIFDRYLAGAGTTVLARELKEKGALTKYGSPIWHDSTILGIIKNEKYKGDLLQGKTFTVDAISGRRLTNNGESDKFYVANHHPAIISKEEFDKANEILTKRSYNRRLDDNGQRLKFSRKFAFSSMLECGFCHSCLVRRSWKSGNNYSVTIWQCEGYAKKGKHLCPYSKGIPETTLENAFVDAYNHMVGDNSELVDEFLKDYAELLPGAESKKLLAANDRKINALKDKQNKLAELYMNDAVTKESYDKEYTSLSLEMKRLTKEADELAIKSSEVDDAEAKIKQFRDMMAGGSKPLDSFNQAVFEICVEKVIVGEDDHQGNADPYKLTFIFKSGFKTALTNTGLPESTEPASTEGHKLFKVTSFQHFWRHNVFKPIGRFERQKVIEDFINIDIVLDVG